MEIDKKKLAAKSCGHLTISHFVVFGMCPSFVSSERAKFQHILGNALEWKFEISVKSKKRVKFQVNMFIKTTIFTDKRYQQLVELLSHWENRKSDNSDNFTCPVAMSSYA